MFRVREQINLKIPSSENNGKGITIAVLDTGVNNHPDIKDRILKFRNFVSRKEEMHDDSGHGTHVCGIACGNGILSNRRYAGIAPKANLIVGKVLNENGDGSVDAMLAGIDWVMMNKELYQVRILNISVGIGGMMNDEKEYLLLHKMEEAWRQGLLVVCAAGNNGPECDTLSKIGKSKDMIAVGCDDGDYIPVHSKQCSSYSARGSIYDTNRKPDIVAPGTEIISINAKFKIDKGNIKHAYTSKSGTSMSAPIISGALALLLGKHPEFDNETAKRKLLYSATDLGKPWYQQGWGMINVGEMMKG